MRLLNEVGRSDWISVRSTQSQLAECLRGISRKVSYFACVTEPTKHVAALLNELYLEAKLAKSSGQDVTEFQKELLLIGDDERKPVIGFLEKNCDRLFNIQSRYIVGDFDGLGSVELQSKLDIFNSIVSEESMALLFDAFGFAASPQLPPMAHLHLNPFEVRLRLDNSALDLIISKSTADCALLKAVGDLSNAKPLLREMRPSFLEAGYFSDANFSENAYLDSNPDIAEAVVLGFLPSGKAHFVEHGYQEGRRMRFKFNPSKKANPAAAAPLELNEAAEQYILKLKTVVQQDCLTGKSTSADAHQIDAVGQE
ncbi:hypothetical protein [Rhizobium rhizogenes]|uniref:hypothetical protein n=1 Tax=Rhizobium rhizogenes TaxID=359 RepID=UPI001571696E|nr:hypothetical protein [Rhizobium rhizogenes]NTF42803.1 hypothetical protein [Rhizobium rhizogenes]